MRLPLRCLQTCWVLLLLALPARAQGPTLDPTFQPGAVYQPTGVDQAIPQPDGKLLLITTATRVGGRPANGQLSRLLANSDQVDTVFAANVAGLQGIIQQAAVLPNNHIVLIAYRSGNLSLGGITRRILGLNADGTVDLAYNAITTAPALTYLTVQPDGKVLVSGYFNEWAPGQSAIGLARLLPNGTLDTAFQAAMGLGFNSLVEFVSVQANGTILVGGRFDNVDGNAQSRLARLLPSGAFDATFRPVLPAASPLVILVIVGAVTQPDGKVVVASFMSPATSAWAPLERRLPSGARDPSFQTGVNFSTYFSYLLRSNPLCLLANGKLLVSHAAGSFDGTAVGELVRLTAAGRLDPTFPNTLAIQPGIREVDYIEPTLTLLPGGQVLAAGTPARFGGDMAPTPLARLDSANGGRVAGFAPRIHIAGEIRDVLRQPDGRYVVGGVFTEINGSASPYLARLTAGGAVEPAFTAAAQPDNPVYGLARQADGKLLVGGLFQALAGTVYPGVGRLLPSGGPDPAFQPVFSASTVAYPVVDQVALEPSGNVLLRGRFTTSFAMGNPHLVRLNGQTGQYDANFSPNYYNADNLLVQPDGNILLAGYRVAVAGQGPVSLIRLLPAGAPDPAFTPFPPDTRFSALAHDPATGQIYAAGDLSAARAVYRFSATGARDLSYASTVPPTSAAVGRSLVLQPNGRLLVGGLFSGSTPTNGYGLVRLLPSGAVDASFAYAAGPGFAVNKVLVQPDGAIVAVGSFTTVGGVPVPGMARLLAPQSLAVGRTHTSGSLAAWPVPAHEVLHLTLDAAAGPARVTLLDALGRPVRAQVAREAAATVSVAGLPAGVYWLRVDYAAGPVTRRVVVE